MAGTKQYAEAVRWAEQAREREEPRSPQTFDALAAACAEAGRFDDAVENAQKALDLAKARNNAPLAAAIAERLALYRASKPYRIRRD